MSHSTGAASLTVVTLTFRTVFHVLSPLSSLLTTTYALENQSKCDRLTKYVDWFPSEPLSMCHGRCIGNDYKN